MKYKTYTFRAYPNKTQEKLFYLTFIMCKTMYNTLLKLILDNYSLFCSKLQESLNNNENFNEEIFSKSHKLPKISTLKKVNNNYKKVDSLALCAEYSNLVRGMEMFYRGHSKRPKFKTRNDKHSYTTSIVNNNIRIIGNKIRLPKVGFIKVRGMREIPSYVKIKRAVVYEDKKGKFYISIIFEYSECDVTINYNSANTVSQRAVGLDFKIGDIFVSSDKLIPKFSTKYYNVLNNIPIRQRIVNRKGKFSKNYWKSTNKLRAIHRQAVNIRKDIQNKISTYLTKKYDYIIIEDLSIKEIVSKLGRGRNAYNTSFNSFVKLLNYKSNGNIIKIDKWFPSSKKCSNCGRKKKHLKLSQRIYRCAFCGNSINRDLNAAINIRNEGMRILGIR